MSRLRNQPVQGKNSNYITNYTNFISETVTSPSITLEEIRTETRKDREIQLLTDSIRTGNFTKGSKNYEKFKTEFSTNNRILLRFNRIIMPHTLQKIALKVVHESQ